MDDVLADEPAGEVATVERELDELRYAVPFNETHAAKLAYRREALERHLARLRELA